jgi:nucleoside-diphosphate-sugar epimerase
MVDTDSGLVYEPLPEDDPMRRQPDTSKARETLGWEPTIPYRDGLAKTIEYFERRLD